MAQPGLGRVQVLGSKKSQLTVSGRVKASKTKREDLSVGLKGSQSPRDSSLGMFAARRSSAQRGSLSSKGVLQSSAVGFLTWRASLGGNSAGGCQQPRGSFNKYALINCFFFKNFIVNIILSTSWAPFSDQSWSLVLLIGGVVIKSGLR